MQTIPGVSKYKDQDAPQMPEDEKYYHCCYVQSNNPASFSVSVWWSRYIYCNITFLMYKCGLIACYETTLMTGSNYNCGQHYYSKINLFSKLWAVSELYWFYLNSHLSFSLHKCYMQEWKWSDLKVESQPTGLSCQQKVMGKLQTSPLFRVISTNIQYILI